MTILEQINKWAEDKSTLIRHTIFKLLSKNHLTSQDFDQLKKILLDEIYYNISVEDVDKEKVNELLEDLESTEDTLILSIEGTQNINALQNSSQLKFNEKWTNRNIW